MSNPTGKGGFQERKHQINRKGRPRSFDALRELALEIAHEPATVEGGRPLVINGKAVTTTEVILRQWARSKDPRRQQAFIEIAYGKVPDSVRVSFGDSDIDRAIEQELARMAAQRKAQAIPAAESTE